MVPCRILRTISRNCGLTVLWLPIVAFILALAYLLFKPPPPWQRGLPWAALRMGRCPACGGAAEASANSAA